MQRDPAYLTDILDAAQLAVAYASGMTEERFLADLKTQDAVIRKMEVIGEAAKRLSDEAITALPGIDWKGFKGFRDVLSHNYDRVDLAIVWATVTTELPSLIALIRARLVALGLPLPPGS
jgi:uncharacterized protein with HEPN domain